jgi:adenylate cyclase
MNRFLRFERKDVLSLLISMAIFIVFLLIFKFTTIFDGLENGSVNFRFYMREVVKDSVKLNSSQGSSGNVRLEKRNDLIHKDLVIVGIDDATLVQFDKEKIQWPFPWSAHTKVTKFIAQDKPAAIYYDIMFESHKPGENEFAKAIADSKCTFLDYAFTTKEADVKYDDQPDRLKVLDRVKFPINQNDNTNPWVLDVLPPNPLLSKDAAGIGFANVRPDPRDNINRKMPLVVKYNGFYYPNIDLVVLMKYYGITQNDVEIKMGEYIKLKNIPLAKMTKPNSERTITIPIDREGFMTINFLVGSQSLPSHSYYYFANDDLSKAGGSLKDMIVMIAAYSTAMVPDVHKAPGFGDLFGIEHHANALNTILMQNFVYVFTDLQNILILFGIALLMGYLFSRISIVWTLVVAFVLLIGYALFGTFIFDSKSVIIAFSTPMIMIVANFAITTAYRLVLEQNEKRYIRQTFSKFVTKSVVDELLRHPEKIKLGGEKKILTVLFSDVRGFTSLSEKLTPEQLVEHLNEYLQAMTEIVFKYEGTLDKYVGDELMAFWGAPVPQEEHALLACRAALEMMAVLRRMNQDWESIGKSPLDIGIGLNSGDMVVGNMGSNSRMDYTLMGDNVNLGARLEGTNKVYGTNIIISEFTYEMVKEKVIVRELDLIRVKGKQLPVTIYELVDVID